MSYDKNLAAYLKFKTLNPHVYEKVKEIARFVKSKGRAKYGIGAIFERLRWISDFETIGDIYKLNNNHRAFMARELEEDSEFESFFELRTQKK